jgi:hypothetical protein
VSDVALIPPPQKKHDFLLTKLAFYNSVFKYILFGEVFGLNFKLELKATDHRRGIFICYTKEIKPEGFFC